MTKIFHSKTKSRESEISLDFQINIFISIMTIDGLNEVKLRALEMAIDFLRDESAGINILKPEDKSTDVFTLANKIYNYISMP